MSENNANGKLGETLAADYLRAKGYSIIATNRKFSHAEIDIIAKIGEEIVFVEVKTRKNSHFGFPEESIDAKKIRLMGKGCRTLLYGIRTRFRNSLRLNFLDFGRNCARNYTYRRCFFPGRRVKLKNLKLVVEIVRKNFTFAVLFKEAFL
jgi:Holliday junction resolvase-like predicted endonuclease